MNKFVGKICPYCKTELKEDEDIVVCSHCDMPHHKDCWIENKGCTTFGCQGTIQGIDIEINTSDSSSPAFETSDNHVSLEKNVPSYCSRCGNKLLSGNLYCSKCGFKVSGDMNSTANFQNEYSSVNQSYQNVAGAYNVNGELNPEFERYIGKNSKYYLKVFSRLKSRKAYSSWNWSAFLFSPLWCMYRKLYSQGIIILIINSVLASIGDDISIILLWVSFISVGAFANYFYMRDLEQKIKRGNILEEPKKSWYINKYAGVNPSGPWIMIAICIFIGLMLQE